VHLLGQEKSIGTNHLLTLLVFDDEVLAMGVVLVLIEARSTTQLGAIFGAEDAMAQALRRLYLILMAREVEAQGTLALRVESCEPL